MRPSTSYGTRNGTRLDPEPSISSVHARPLLEPLERLAGAPARSNDAVVGVEDEHELAALLDQPPPPLGGEPELGVLAAERRCAGNRTP